jgi:hypothetical protein
MAAKARSTLSPYNIDYSTKALKSYTKALRTIGLAVADEEASRDADLLCAVQMLSMYEVRSADQPDPNPTSC